MEWPLTPRHQAALNSLKDALSHDKSLWGLLPIGDRSDFELARVLIARKGDVKATLAQLKDIALFHRDVVPNTVKDSHVEEFFRHAVPRLCKGVSKEGFPVVWMRIFTPVGKLLDECGHKGVMNHHVLEQLETVDFLRKQGKSHLAFVIDIRGLSLKPSKAALNVLRETFKIDERYFPERLGWVVVVNAPKMFEPLWKVLRLAMDAHTASKISILSSDDFQPVLQEKIDIEMIPKEYGGKANWRVPFRPMQWPHYGDLMDQCGDLPPGWEEQWSDEHKRFYYVNHADATTSWERPNGKGLSAEAPPPTTCVPVVSPQPAATTEVMVQESLRDSLILEWDTLHREFSSMTLAEEKLN